MTTIGQSLRDRYLDVVGSIYIYNEYRGYTSLDRVLEAVRARCGDDPGFMAEVERHRADERKHYVMFRRWFERRGQMPLALGPGFGHIDRFVEMVFGCRIDELDTAGVISDPAAFERLCRIIMLTEQRGLAQVEVLLASSAIRSDRVLHRIFTIIHADEPEHFLPYRRWLERRQRPLSLRRERMADWLIHKLLMLVKLPVLFLSPGHARLEHWPDAAEAPVG